MRSCGKERNDSITDVPKGNKGHIVDLKDAFYDIKIG